jgi:SAM-dependent methyltransferase
VSLFGAYARSYDLLYRDKDYGAEVDCLEALFVRFAGRRPVRSVLDLGCGTGGHVLPLAARGYAVTGADRSGGMLAAARRKAATAGLAARFVRGDVRRLRIGRRFDAVIAMFAVLGYQTGDEDIRAALATAAAHLRPGGLLVCDVWFGPAVLHDPPRERVKEAREGDRRVVRRSTSELDLLRQVVAVRFETEERCGRALVGRSEEVHRMRFFFPREIALLLAGAGLRPRLLAPFLRPDAEPGLADWTVMVVADRPAQKSGAARRTTAR